MNEKETRTPGYRIDETPDNNADTEFARADADVAKLATDLEDLRQTLLRRQADFENYKKRIIRQQTEHLERAAEALVEKLLPVLDTFDLALVHDEGFDQVLASLMGVLEKEGLERIQPDGEAFDPNEHDAVAHEPRDDDVRQHADTAEDRAHGARMVTRPPPLDNGGRSRDFRPADRRPQ